MATARLGQTFDDDAKALMLSNHADATRLDAHADYRAAVPAPDHFILLVYLAGLAGVATDKLDVLVDGYAHGSLSMTTYTLGLACAAAGVQSDSQL